MDITVNQGNTLASLVLNLKDADTLSPVQVHLIEEHQYSLALGAVGTKTLTAILAAPNFTNTPRDGIPNFDPGNGLTELQLQYPFSAGGSGAILDVTIHEIRILDARAIPEPGTLSIVLAGLALAAWRSRRNKRRQPDPSRA